MKKTVIRVGFCATGGKSWYGGVTYVTNILSALVQSGPDVRIEPVICTGYFLPKHLTDLYRRFGKVIRSFAFNAYPATLLYQGVTSITKMIFKKTYIDIIMDRNNIRILSYGNHTVTPPHRNIFWIPDFQHLHFPQYFSDTEIRARDMTYRRQIDNADMVIVSSQSVKKDFLEFAPGQQSKVHVLPFVSTIDKKIFDPGHGLEYLQSTYKIPQKYFFMSHQFWQHKNHRVVFESVAMLKKKGIPVSIVCSGNLSDWRNVRYIETLKEGIRRNHLENDIHILGFIPYEDVLRLARHSIAVINPSMSEGWNTSVEEAKAMGKICILSAIPVHVEQKPEAAYYFDPNDAYALSKILTMVARKQGCTRDKRLEHRAELMTERRKKMFAKRYVKLLKELL